MKKLGQLFDIKNIKYLIRRRTAPILFKPEYRESPDKIRQFKINSRWVAGPIGQTNHRPSDWCSKYYFFLNFIGWGHSKLFTLIFVFSKKNKQIDWKYFCKEFCKKSGKKNNTWNIRRLVDDSFVPSGQRLSVNLS